ncbi:invasion associated locus B family protein [Agrobacterium rubi]|uniref:invasion associated locus B family protein n=1 Tax=Agrobacterium rubi TaxID=28099 RepID=UPI00201B8593|nr:invasion associated locus B family protein [Agrobacterium rubi]
MKCISLKILALAAVYSAAVGQSFAQSPSPDASQPSSLAENYGDWSVRCVTKNETRECAFSQTQLNTNSQRVLVAELRPQEDGSLRGSLVLPFGLRLADGTTFAVDDLPPGKPAPFRTCLPVGCLVSLIFTEKVATSLRTGTTLKVIAKSSDTGEDVAFSVSLKGFDTALQRTTALGRR